MIVSGGLSTATSISSMSRPSTVLRTQPPTNRAATPAWPSDLKSTRTGCASIHAGASRRPDDFMRSASWREEAAVTLVLGEEHHDEARDRAGKARDGEPGDGHVLPCRQSAGDLALLLDLHRPRPQEEGGGRRRDQHEDQQYDAHGATPWPASLAGGEDKMQVLQHTGSRPPDVALSVGHGV